MSQSVAWIKGQITLAAPGAELQPLRVGTSLTNLSEALAALDGVAGVLFGMHMNAAVVEARLELAAQVRATLLQWEQQMVGRMGAEGTRVFRSQVSRAGVVLWEPAPAVALSADEARVLDALTAALHDSDRLTNLWRAAGDLEPDERARVRVGAPDPPRLERVSQAFAADMGAPLPALLHALWSRHNGIEIEGTSDPDAAPYAVVNDVYEPVLWPADVQGEHFLETEGDGQLFILGELPDSGYAALRARGGESHVVWVPRRALGAPTTIAPDLVTFLSTLVETGFALRAVLRKARVPGWGA